MSGDVEVTCGRCSALVAVARGTDDGELDVFPVIRVDRARAEDGAGFDGLTSLGRIRVQRNRYGRGGRPAMSRLMVALHPLGPDDDLEPRCGCPGPPVPARTVRRLAVRGRARGEHTCAIPRR